MKKFLDRRMEMGLLLTVLSRRGGGYMKSFARISANIAFLMFVMVFICNLSLALADVIIDNGEPGTTSTGTWSVSGGTNPYGTDSLWSRDGSTYTWQFTSQPAGAYEVFMWWSGWSSRATNIPVTINHSGGSSTMSINQRQNAGQWNSLGHYNFNTEGSVMITAAYGSTVSTCADAVRFVLVDTPTAHTITATAGSGGSISPSGAVSVADGADQTFTITPNTGYHVADVVVDGNSAGAVQTYTFTNVTANHTIAATFASDTPTQEIIIDNQDAETSQTGLWQVSGADGHYLDDSVWNRDGYIFTFHFTPSQTGNYELSMWWTYWSSRSTSVPVDIEYAGSTARVYINQKQNGGRWNVIDTYPFQAGETYDITITSQPGPSSTCADAVRFVYVGGGTVNTPPEALIDSISPNPALPGVPVSFIGHGIDSDGDEIVGYSWRSSIQGALSSDSSFSHSTLAEGTHVIYFKVQDNNGAWSPEANTIVSVRSCATPAKIMPLGDSITLGTYGSGETRTEGYITGYRQPLYQSLSNAGYYIDFVGSLQGGQSVTPLFDYEHEGHGGWRDDQVAGSIYQWLTAHPADIILLHIGTNGLDTNPSDVENILNEIDRRSEDITVILARIINRKTYSAATTQFNNNIQAMAENRIANGDKIIIVDQESALTYPDDMWDDLHPNENGYNKMDDIWLNALTKLLPVCETTPQLIISATVGGNGNISPSGAVPVRSGTNQTFTITPNAGYHVADVVVDGNSAGAVQTYTFTNVTEDHTIAATFASDTPTAHTITATAGSGGSISPSGAVSVADGADQTFTITPNTGYHVADVVVDGNSAGAVQTYTFTNVKADHTIAATFASDTPTQEIIIDNRDAATSQTGTWEVSGASDPYGVDSVWNRDGYTFTWHFTPPQSGNYELSMWWTYWSSRSNYIPVDIEYATGSTARVYINQQENGGMWNVLGTFAFEAGISYRVTIISQPGPSSTCADAVKFSFLHPLEPNSPPVATIRSIRPDPSYFGAPTTFRGRGEDTDGSITAYSWESSLDGFLGDVSQFTISSLSVGTHIITFKVMDNAGEWSAPVTRTLEVLENEIPQAIIDSITPNPARIGETVTFTGHGQDLDGTITGYSWDSDVDGHLSNDQTFTMTFLSQLSMGTRTISFSVYDDKGAVSSVSQILTIEGVQPSVGILRHKWTVDLPGNGQIMPVMGDIDNDGDQEIVMATGRYIVVVNGKTGRIERSVSCNGWCASAVELVDLNRDGVPEILYGTTSSRGPRLNALNGNGSIRWTSIRLGGNDLGGIFPIAAYDIDGDGYPTIYFATEDQDPSPYNGNINDYTGALTMLNHNGNVLGATWLHHPCWGGVSLADANFDGVFEVYVGDRRQGYQDFPAKGPQAFNAHTLETLWTRPDIQHSSPIPVIADVTGDGILDVVATKITLAGPMILDFATGANIYDYSNRNLPTHGTPTLYDIDGDGNLEFITSTSYPTSAPRNFVVFDLIDGTIDFTDIFDIWVAWPPQVGDVTGDGHMEILVASGNQPDVVGDTTDRSYPLLVYDKNFNLIERIHMPTGTGQLTPARVYDTDSDGYNEVVVAGYYGKLMVFDTYAPTPNPPPRTWVQRYSEYRRGAAEYVHPPTP